MNDEELVEAQKRIRRRAFPKFFKFTELLRGAIVDFCEGGSDDPLLVDGVREEVDIDEANCFSSLIKSSQHSLAARSAETREAFVNSLVHYPVLDIDLPCLLIDSSTPGHHHLIIQKEMSWPRYKKLLNDLADAGIIEEGFARASISREASWARTPWTKKGQDEY